MKYIISSISGEVDNDYLTPLSDCILEKNSESKIFHFTENHNYVHLKSKEIKKAEKGKVNYITNNLEELEKIFKYSKKNIENSLVIFNNPFIKADDLYKFSKENTTNDVLLVRQNFLLFDYEKELIKTKEDCSFYLEVFNNDFDYEKNNEALIKSFTQEKALVYVYSQWKANVLKETNNVLSRVLIDLKKDKIISLGKETVASDFDKFIEFFNIPKEQLSFEQLIEIIL